MTFMSGAMVGVMVFLISLATIIDARERLRQWYGEMPALAFMILLVLLFLWAAAGGFLAMRVF